MKITIATSAREKEQAFKIRTNVFVNEQKVPMDIEIDEHEDESIHFVGYKDDYPVAASRLRWVDQTGKLERICILKEHRGKSYGSQIIETMEDEIIKKGYTQSTLNGQTQAVKFYEQLGYKVISDEFLDANIPHVTMVKQLITTS